MKNKKPYLIGALIIAVIAIGGLAFYQNSGNLFQGALTRSYTQSTPTNRSYTQPEETKLPSITTGAPGLSVIENDPISQIEIDKVAMQLTRMEEKIDALAASIQNQNIKIDAIDSSVTKVIKKINKYALSLADIGILDCVGSNVDYSNCSSAYMNIQFETAIQ